MRFYYNRQVVADGFASLGVRRMEHSHLGGDIAVHHAVRFAYHLRRFRPDVLIVGTFRKLWLAALGARLAGVPLTVARIGLSTDLPRSSKYRFAYRRMVDLVVTNADDLRDAYLEALPEAPPPRIITIHKGIEAPVPVRSRSEIRQELGVPEDALLVGGVGRLVEQKRFDRFLECLSILPEDVHGVIVGGGPLEDELKGLARDRGLTSRVHFAGHRTDVPDVMGGLDLLVVSSDRESLANVMLEALAAGVPVVSTDVSGAREALRPLDDGGRPGSVVPKRAEALASVAGPILQDEPRRRAMAAAARRAAELRFGRERMLDEWEAALLANG